MSFFLFLFFNYYFVFPVFIVVALGLWNIRGETYSFLFCFVGISILSGLKEEKENDDGQIETWRTDIPPDGHGKTRNAPDTKIQTMRTMGNQNRRRCAFVLELDVQNLALPVSVRVLA